MMKFNFKQFFVKNKNIIIAVCVCIAVFTAAYFAGGDLSSDSNAARSVISSSASAVADETVTAAVESTEKNEITSEASASAASSEISTKSTSTTAAALTSGATYSNSAAAVTSNKDTTQSSQSDSTRKISASAETEKSETAETTATQDKYKTDPTPTDKPQPVEPQQATTTDESLYCTFTITCETILDNMDKLSEDKVELVPSDGIIFKKQKVEFTEGESVYTVLVRVCKENGIHLESTQTPAYNTAYIEGIGNLYEFDCGTLSGWTYKVNGWVPNYGCSRYQLEDGDDVIFCYTCDLGNDVGSTYTVGE